MSGGANLVFLVSQPRAGSTLLARVLASHPQIHAAGEPWLLLGPLQAPGRGADDGTGEGVLASQALRAFLKELPDGEASWRAAVARLAEPLYAEAAAAAGKRVFLDKTPRYYKVLPELRATFPAARFVILLRHPLAVLHSIVETWVRPDWLFLTRFGDDLVSAPRRLCDGLEALGASAVIVHYEAFVADPETQTKRLCSALDVAFHPPMLAYAESALPRWAMGDQKIYQLTRPVTTSVELWKQGLADPQFWRLASDYAARLGPTLLAQLGYPLPEIEAVLANARPPRSRLATTFSLDEALGTVPPGRIAAGLQRFTAAWARRGLRAAALGGVAWLRGVKPPSD